MRDEVTSNDILRFAVAMRGGVSLAVWIGGALFEIDRLRRNEDAFTQALFAVTRFGSVEVDILTGASAGGLNAAVGGLAISQGVAPILKKTWIESADIDGLLAWDSGAPFRPAPKRRKSILSGRYFLGQIVDRLEATAKDPSPEDERCRSPVQVFLAATVLGGVTVTDPEDPDLSDQRHEAYFHFRHLARNRAFSDFEAPDIAATLGRCARATASFPAAFEPEVVQPADLTGRLRLPPAFAEPTEVTLYDGGVVDNIPVARAIRAAAAAPAVEAVRRWVLFLHPSPSLATQPVGTSTPGPRRFPSIPEVVADVVATKATETLLDDLDVLRLHNRDAESQALQRHSACHAALRASGQGLPAADLASVDADWLYGLLEDPLSTLPWIPVGTNAPPSALQGVSGDQRFKERISLLTSLLAQGGTIRPFARIARLAHLTIDWIRWEEEHGGRNLGDQRRIVYDVLLLAELVEAALCGTFLRAGPQDRIAALKRSLKQAEGSSELHALVGLAGIRRSARNDRAPFVERLSSGPRETLMALAKGDVPMGGRSPHDGAASERLLGRLVGVAAVVHAAAASRTPPVEPSLFKLLNEHLDDRGDESAVRSALVAIDAACAGFHRGRLVGTPRTLEYLRISGAQPTTLAGTFAPDQLPKLESLGVVGGAVDPKTKLAGDRLGNFSAFLSRRFRANDWMWGRMDAAAGLVEVLLRRDYLSNEVEHLVERVGAVVLAPLPERDGVDPALTAAASLVCADLWDAYRDTVCTELIAACNAPPHDEGPAVDLATVRDLVTTRWQLELFVEDIGGVLDEPLDGGRHHPLPPLSMPADAKEARNTLAEAMKAYDGSPRRAGDLWGRRRTSALGVKVAKHIAYAAVPGRLARTVAGAALMAAASALLLRGLFLVAWALLVNLVLVPRLTTTAQGVVVGASAVVEVVVWLKFVRRSGGGQLRVWSSALIAAGATGFGALALRWGQTPFGPPKRVETTSLQCLLASGGWPLGRSVIAVAVATALATGLLWVWAKRWWMVGLGIVAGLVMGWWDVIGSWREPPDADLSLVWRVQLAFGSMWFGALFLVALATTLALCASPEDR